MRQFHKPAKLVQVVTASAVVAAGSILAAPSATAAEVAISGATIEWGFSEVFQSTAAGCFYFSAGVGAGSGGTEEVYSSSTGNVSIQKITGGTAAAPVWEQATWANKCETSVGDALNQKVVLSGGEGTVDSSTGATQIDFTGTFTLNMHSPVVISDPVLSLGADGTGTLSATVGSTAGAVIAKIGADRHSASGAGFSTTPIFYGETITVNGAAQPTDATKLAYDDAFGADPAAWGAWPESFVNAAPPAVRAFFYTTYSSASGITAGNLRKPTNSLTVSYGTEVPGFITDIAAAIKGKTEVGKSVRAIVGKPSSGKATVLDYSWLVNGVEKGTASKYTIEPVDAGKKLTLVVTATAPGSLPTASTAGPVTVVPPKKGISGVSAKFAGKAVVGAVLDAVVPTKVAPEGATLAYKWQICGVDVVDGVTNGGQTLTVTADHKATADAECLNAKGKDAKGKTLSLVVTAKFSGYPDKVVSSKRVAIK